MRICSGPVGTPMRSVPVYGQVSINKRGSVRRKPRTTRPVIRTDCPYLQKTKSNHIITQKYHKCNAHEHKAHLTRANARSNRITQLTTFTNTRHAGIQLSNDANETFTVGTLDALVVLRDEIDNYLEKRGKTEYITTFNAIRLAQAEGYDLPTTTVTNACIRGTIPNTKKLAGRWRMPKAEFDIWYAEWKTKKVKHPITKARGITEKFND
jgi:hypothetical protein